MDLHLSCTGTQRGMTRPQLEVVRATLVSAKEAGYTTLHHGDCIGADFEFATLARAAGLGVWGHPCTLDSKRAWFRSDVEEEPKAPLLRNDDLVAWAAWLLATPGEAQELRRSGTWSTIRRARGGSPHVTIIYPDGSLGE